MNCALFERQLSQWLADESDSAPSTALELHASGCADCNELWELAQLSAPAAELPNDPPPGDLFERVMIETAGGGCAAAEASLCAFLDSELGREDRELVRGHLDHCKACSGLAETLESLRLDLPLLANITPGARFVSAVLRATLPAHVLLRRWWERAWPRWVHRPRFALEAAYVATLVLVVIFATPVSPLQAMPSRAAQLVQSVPKPALGGRVAEFGEAVDAQLDEAQTKSMNALSEHYRAAHKAGRSAFDRSRESVQIATTWTIEQIRTFWDEAASLLESADGDDAAADPDTEEETP